VRRLRLTIIFPVIITLVIAGGLVSLWHIGGQTLNNSADQATADNNRLAAASRPINSPSFLPLPIYQLGDIPTSAPTADDKIILVDYRRAVAKIMAPYNNRAIENELALVVKAAESNDERSVVKIVEASQRHATAAIQLKALVVPSAIAQVHLNLVNSLIGLAESSYIMSKIGEEPMLALEMAQIYPTRLKNFFAATNNLNLFLLANNIVVPESEQSIVSLGL